MNYLLDQGNEYQSFRRIFPVLKIRQIDGRTQDVTVEQLRKNVNVLAALLSRPEFQPLAQDSLQAGHFSEEETSALAFFKIQCILWVKKMRIKCSPKPQISEPDMSISMMSAPLPAITTEPLALRAPSSEGNCDGAKCTPANAQPATKGAAVHLHCNSAATKDPTEIGYGEYPDGPLIAPASNATSPDNCAAKPAAGNLHEEFLKESDLPLGPRTSKGIKVKPDYDEISACRQAGISTFHCWKHYVAINVREPTYGKAMFYKLVNDHEKHQLSRTHPGTSVHSLPIP